VFWDLVDLVDLKPKRPASVCLPRDRRRVFQLLSALPDPEAWMFSL